MFPFLPSLSDVANEVITGFIGGGIVALLALLLRIYKQKKIERSFPVAGEYISFYEDVSNGEPTLVASESSIAQKGAALKITTRLRDERSWTLTGNILQGGHVSGVYSADAVYDDGVGSFYLKISKDNLDGMWNGYDHENKMTNSGRYWFRRKLPVTIKPYHKKYLSDILHTSANAFGYGYVDTSSIGNDADRFALIATVRGEFAGFCFGERIEAHGLQDTIKMDLGVIPDDVNTANLEGQLGVLQTIAVRKKFQGHGIGSKLFSKAESNLKELSCKCILVPAWSVASETPMRNILLSRDYAEWCENPDFWRTDCEARKFECVSFNGQCQCSVAFFRKGRLQSTPHS